MLTDVDQSVVRDVLQHVCSSLTPQNEKMHGAAGDNKSWLDIVGQSRL